MAMDDAVTEADLADPNPDVGDLFHHYDDLYFQGALAAAGFTVQWRSSSSSASRSFGSCIFSRQQNTITLSESFLKYRSCSDRKNALLHEMIHAIIYVKRHKNDRNHGPAFRAWMDAINSCCVQDRQRPDGGYNITIRHDFITEEPHSLKGTLWKCRSCGDTLLRPTNQGPPSDACCIENDDISASCGNMLCYWHNHKNDCSGTYEKTMLILEAPSQKKVAGGAGAQLLLTLPSEMSKSKGAIQESSSSVLQLECSTKTTKLNAEDKHLCRRSGSNGKPQGSSSSKKADTRRSPQKAGETSVLPAAPQGKPNQNNGLVAMVKQAPVSVEGCNVKSPWRNTSKKTAKQHKPDDLQKTSVLPSAPQGTPKLKHALVATENSKLSSAEHCSDAKSPKSNTSKKAGERHENRIAQKACSQPANPKKRLKQGPAAPEKKELSPLLGCSNEKLLDWSFSKKAYRQQEPEDIQKTTVLPSAPGIKPMALASEKQRKGKCKRKPVKEKEYAVMSAWLNYYESDRSSGSTEPLVNKRTERRRRERERAKYLTYSRSKKIKTEPKPSVNSPCASVSSHKIEMAPQDESMQQSRPPSPCSDHAVVTTANQVVVTPATRDQSQPSAPCLDVVPFLQPADPTSPDQGSAPDMIVISDDDI